MAEKEIDLLHECHESGQDGYYERDTYYKLILGMEGYTTIATLEVRLDKRQGTGPTKTTVTRHKIGVKDLVALVQKHGERVE